MRKIKNIGAGGNWERIGEKFDFSVIKQTDSLACVSAVGEMLLKARGFEVSQTEIAEFIGKPSNSEKLAEYFNQLESSKNNWIGGFFDVKYLEKIIATGTWGAVLREGSPLGHMVLVEGIDRNGLIKIKDPFDQTSYRMTKSIFLRYLSEFICEKK